MENIKPQLLTFLPESGLPLTVLTIGKDYLVELRRKLPNGRLFAVVEDADEDTKELCDKLHIALHQLDIYAEPLPFDAHYFDYIVSDLTLERAANPQDIAAGFGTFIKPTGAWLTSFRNIRHWSVLADLMDGHYYHVVSRLYAKQEFERLLYASFYKEVRMRPQLRECDDDLTAKLIAVGFNNGVNDLNTEFWLVRAAMSMPELALLKSVYDEATREQFSRIIHRIEYDVFAERECTVFWQLYDDKEMFVDYAAAFAAQTVFHQRRFYENMLKFTDEGHLSLLNEMLDAAIKDALSDETRAILEGLRNEQ